MLPSIPNKNKKTIQTYQIKLRGELTLTVLFRVKTGCIEICQTGQ